MRRGRLDKARFLGVFDRERRRANKALVECEEPLCGSLNTGHETFSQGYYQLWCEDADVETIDQLPERVLEEVEKAIATFDAERMGSIIRLKRRQLLERYERKPADSVSQTCLEAFLYGPSWNADTAAKASENLLAHLDSLSMLKTAMAVTVDEDVRSSTGPDGRRWLRGRGGLLRQLKDEETRIEKPGSIWGRRSSRSCRAIWRRPSSLTRGRHRRRA